MESDILKTCRSCLRTCSRLRNLFESFTDDGLLLSKCYEICVNLEVRENDQLPKMICIMCESNLMAAFHFQRQCVESVSLFLVQKSKVPFSKDVSPSLPASPKDTSFVFNFKQEVNEQCEFETEPEDELETKASPIKILKKIEEQERCISPDPPQESLDKQIISMEQNTIPIVKDSRYFKCEKCSKSFISNRHLEIHIKSHKKDPYICDICNRKCPSKSVLKIHQKKHRAPAFDKTVVVPNNIENNKEMFVVEYLYGFRPE